MDQKVFQDENFNKNRENLSTETLMYKYKKMERILSENDKKYQTTTVNPVLKTDHLSEYKYKSTQAMKS